MIKKELVEKIINTLQFYGCRARYEESYRDGWSILEDKGKHARTILTELLRETTLDLEEVYLIKDRMRNKNV